MPHKMFSFVILSVSLLFSPASFATEGAWSKVEIDPKAIPLKKKFAIKTLTLGMFEIGNIEGDAPGEGQYWVERDKMRRRYSIPGSFSPLYCNDQDECALVAGMSTANATASVMAVGLHPYVDLSKTYVMVAGIAGGNPSQVTLGSATWADSAVDSDNSFHIDMRELDRKFEFANFHLGCGQPWCDQGWSTGTEVFHLNPKLTGAAFEISKDVLLVDSPAAQVYRKKYVADEAAKREPFVARCDTVSGGNYYHGKQMGLWADWWVKQWTKGQGHYCSVAMEETGVMTALTRLAAYRRADLDRVMVLRAIANFDRPHEGQTALESLMATSGGIPIALENVYRVGSKVTNEILAHWAQWKNGVPETKKLSE